jgi:hypothetical protein
VSRFVLRLSASVHQPAEKRIAPRLLAFLPGKCLPALLHPGPALSANRPRSSEFALRIAQPEPART